MRYRTRAEQAWYGRQHYKANREDYLARTRKASEERRAIVRAAKDRPCADCGVRYPYYVMQFDHLGGKSFTIAEAGGRSVENIRAEIAKCDVVCANCHAVRTYQRSVLNEQQGDPVEDDQITLF